MAYIGNEPISAAFLTDTFSGNGSTVAFTMTVAPANTSSILVAVTGVVQDPSTYSVVGTTLTFSAAPPSGTNNISVRYLGIPASGVTTTAYRTQTEFTATAGQTTFTVPSYTVGFIDVYRNGLLLGSADFTATTGTTVVLANACTADDFIETVSFYVSSVLNAIPATAGSVGTTYLANSSVTTDKIAAGAVVQADLATGVAGTGPAFSAYATTQTISNATATKITNSVEQFDTNSNYDPTTNYRFQPTVAGYYQINGRVTLQVTNAAVAAVAMIYKNGLCVGIGTATSTTTAYPTATVSQLVSMNGSTDYVELYGYNLGGSSYSTVPGVFTTGDGTNFSGSLVRAA